MRSQLGKCGAVSKEYVSSRKASLMSCYLNNVNNDLVKIHVRFDQLIILELSKDSFQISHIIMYQFDALAAHFACEIVSFDHCYLQAPNDRVDRNVSTRSTTTENQQVKEFHFVSESLL